MIAMVANMTLATRAVSLITRNLLKSTVIPNPTVKMIRGYGQELRTSQARAALTVAHVRLDRANEEWILGCAPPRAAIPLLKSTQLLAVTGHCAGAVRLDIVYC